LTGHLAFYTECDRVGTGSAGHMSPGQRLWPGRVGSRANGSDSAFDLVWVYM